MLALLLVTGHDTMSEPATKAAICDVLVIGGGPAGATVGALLARNGYQVTVIEKDRFPRFHIGESLLPVNLELFEQLGVLDQVERIGMIKNAAQFDSMYHGRTQSFYFSGALNRRHAHSYEVHRADLDQILLDNCRSEGATVLEEMKVAAVSFEDTKRVHVVTRDKDGDTEWSARFIVDASGRDTFMASRLKSKKPHAKHASAAVYGHFDAVERLTGGDAGNISVFWFDHGWFWLIPLQDGVTSVGMVCWPYYLKSRKTDLDTFFSDSVATCPPLAARMRHAKPTRPITATGNYSYLSGNMTGDRYLMLGDAFAFIDPIFSSGVLLAMKSAFFGAETVDACLRSPGNAVRLQRRFEKRVTRGLGSFTWLIFRMTNPVMRNLLMSPSNLFGIESAVLAILAGDVHDNPQARRRMLLFKAIYYLSCLGSIRAAIGAYWNRRRLIRHESATF